MLILLMDAGGQQYQGLLLAGSSDQMRIVAPGTSDTLALRQIDGRWMTESGAPIEIAAVRNIDAELFAESMPQPKVQVCAAMTV